MIIDTTTSPIHIFDEQLTLHDRVGLFDFALASSYRIGWADSHELEKFSCKDMYSSVAPEEAKLFGLEQIIRRTEIWKHVENYNVTKIAINLTRSCDVHYAHTHPEDYILLYYMNLSWQDGWEGETFFYKENGKDIDIVLPYTPGRFVLFQGKRPHSIRAQSSAAPQYRFTMAIGLNKKERKEEDE